jgi:hypothetical protein
VSHHHPIRMSCHHYIKLLLFALPHLYDIGAMTITNWCVVRTIGLYPKLLQDEPVGTQDYHSLICILLPPYTFMNGGAWLVGLI